jgi:hypothetical protein
VRASGSVAIGQFPLEQPPCARDEQAGHQQDAAHQGSGEQRLARIARRPGHDAVLLGLEGQHEPQRHRRGHVYPQDLGRQDRQRRAQGDRHQNHQALTDIRRQGPRDELREIVEDAAAFLDCGLHHFVAGQAVMRARCDGYRSGHEVVPR